MGSFFFRSGLQQFTTPTLVAVIDFFFFRVKIQIDMKGIRICPPLLLYRICRLLRVSKVYPHYHFLGCYQGCCVQHTVMNKLFRGAELKIVLLVFRQWARAGLAIFHSASRCISIVAFYAFFTMVSSSIIFAVLTRQKEMIR